MTATILATKLHRPPPQPRIVRRPRLIDHLNDGLHRTLTLVSAPAGFGKTTLLTEWLETSGHRAAWLSLDEVDSEPARFLTYLVAAIRTVLPGIGSDIEGPLQSPQPPPVEAVLTTLINEILETSEEFILILDDYHAVDSQPVDGALSFLLEHQPPNMHLVVATREDPHLPLPRLRARGQLTELRAANLRFTPAEAAEFLNQVMGLTLSADDIAALESRTEGWIAGLQLAAISLQGHEDAASFVRSFTGSHRFVLDYLVEEVLQRQPGSVQRFLLATSILNRMCGPLCDALLRDTATSGQEMLEHLEHANLFVVPLDNERHWYRYHHLFAELLRQRALQSAASSNGDGALDISELHRCASDWFEENGLEVEAFQHAASAHDIERVERLILGAGVPLYVRGTTTMVLRWLESLPPEVLDARPSLRVMLGTVLAVAGKMTRVEEQLQAAEAALRDVEPDDATRDLTGRIADLRALIALFSGDPDKLDTIIAQARRALEYLRSDNVPGRAATLWKMGLAHYYKGDRAAARSTNLEALSAAEASGNVHINILASSIMGKIQESDNQLHEAVETYRRVLQLVGEPPGPIACEAYAGLCRIYYEWNDLEAAEEYGCRSVQLARQLEISSFVTSELAVARVKLASGDVAGALALLDQTEHDAMKRDHLVRMPEIAEMRVLALLQQGSFAEAEQLSRQYDLPVSLARIHLARGDTRAALDLLPTARKHVESREWHDRRLQAMVLEAVAFHAHGDEDSAVELLAEALALAETEGFVRLFVDEGMPMARLLSVAAARGIVPDYTSKLLSAHDAEGSTANDAPPVTPAAPAQPLIEPLSQRELEVLRLIAQGLSNREISERLFVALNTVKGHNRIIFDKLDVRRRTEAVARARELGLL